jgi:hypothetical protein
MMPTACLKSRLPALMKIIVKMITAEDESSNTVIPVPIRIERNKFLVYFLIMILALSVNTSLRTSDNWLIENRNRTNPPMSKGSIWLILKFGKLENKESELFTIF